MTRHIRVSPGPERYFSGLTKAMKVELLRRHSKLGLARSNSGVPKRKSHWTRQFHKVYPNLKFNKQAISKRTGIPVKNLDTVYDRGLKAWKTGGSRPGVTPQQWAIARVYKFVLVSMHKAPKEWYITRPDPNSNLRR